MSHPTFCPLQAEEAATQLRLECTTTRTALDAAQSEASSLKAELEAARGVAEERCCSLERELARQQERGEAAAAALVAAERQLELQQAQGKLCAFYGCRARRGRGGGGGTKGARLLLRR